MLEYPIKHDLPIWAKIVFVFSLLIGICFWSNLALNINPWGTRWAYLFFFLYFVIIVTDRTKRWKVYKWEFSNVITWTIVTIFFSFIPAYVDWGQSILMSISGSIKYTWVLLLYFIIRKWNVSTSFLMKYIIVISIVWVVIEVGQQFTYPNYWFAGKLDESNGVYERMGLYRFYIWGVDFVMLSYAYCLGKFAVQKETFPKIILMLWIIFFIGLLCYCSRKHIYVSFLVVGYVALVIRNKYRNYIRLIFALLICLIFYYFYDDYSEMNQTAIEAQGEGEDFIRLLSLKYYLFDFSDSPLYFLLGSGIPGDSALGSLTTYLIDYYGFYRADIGIFGYYTLFGIVGISAILLYLWTFVKNWKYIDLWLKLFFIMKVVLIVFDFWAMWNVGMMAYAIFLYMLDLNIQKNKGLRIES